MAQTVVPMVAYEDAAAASDWLIDSHFARPRAAGATMLSEIEDNPFGRLYRVEDVEGHRWMFMESKRQG